MAELTDPWDNPAFLRDVQYKTDANLAARQSIYAYQHPRVDLAGAGARPGRARRRARPIADVGCGNGVYLAELARRGFAGRVLGVDLSLGMLAAARERLTRSAPAAGRSGPATRVRAWPAGATRPRCRCRDGAADLTLAMHMLYHVPDPRSASASCAGSPARAAGWSSASTALDHLRQLRAAVAAARGDGRGGRVERVTLDDGEALARSFFSR